MTVLSSCLKLINAKYTNGALASVRLIQVVLQKIREK